MTNEQEAIEERLGKLERQNRQMKLAWLGTLAIAAVVVLAGLAWPRGSASAQAGGSATVIRATSFVLVVAQGRERATLEMYEGGPRLALNDANGKTRVGLGEFSDGPTLALLGATGKLRAMLVAVPGGGRRLLFSARTESREQS